MLALAKQLTISYLEIRGYVDSGFLGPFLYLVTHDEYQIDSDPI